MSLFQESSEERPVSVNKQRLGATGDRPARPTLIEQVLNQKRLVTTHRPPSTATRFRALLTELLVCPCVPQSLLRSPEVISFLQHQQQVLATQTHSQPHQHFQAC